MFGRMRTALPWGQSGALCTIAATTMRLLTANTFAQDSYLIDFIVNAKLARQLQGLKRHISYISHSPALCKPGGIFLSRFELASELRAYSHRVIIWNPFTSQAYA